MRAFWVVLTFGFFVLVGLNCVSPLWAFFDLLIAFLFGWITYLFRVGPEATINPEGIITALLALVLLTIGFHAFAGWLYRQTGKPGEPRVWQRRWTGAIIGVIVLMFAAGIAMVGVTHQTVWLVRSPEPFISNSFGNGGARIASAVNLKQLTLAVISNVDQEGEKNPLGVLMDPQGRLLHGWHARVLPQMDNDDLYKSIDFTKPWDHPDNRPAMSKVFKPFLHPLVKKQQEDGFGLSHYAGNVLVLGYRMPPFPQGFTDGPSQTIMIGEVSTNLKPWGHPIGWRDFALGVQRSPNGFGGPIKGRTQVALCDGSVRIITDKISLSTLKAASTPAGNDVLGNDW